MSDNESRKGVGRGLRGWASRVAKAVVARRRQLTRLAIVALAVLVFVLIPGYLASRPKFLARYASLDEPYSTWSKSTHAEVPCQRCHVAPSLVAQALFDARMLAEFYVSIVLPARQPKLFDKPTNAACSACHRESRTVSSSGDLKIPHSAHVKVLKLRCVYCHNYVVHKPNPEGTHTPRMSVCLTCHDGRKAKKECSACHTRKNFPDNHRAADWLVVHPSKQSEIDCKKCHGWTTDWCRQCHTQRPASHAGRWRTNHPVKVQSHRNCEACHEGSFCIRCHGEVPGLNFDPALKFVR